MEVVHELEEGRRPGGLSSRPRSWRSAAAAASRRCSSPATPGRDRVVAPDPAECSEVTTVATGPALSERRLSHAVAFHTSRMAFDVGSHPFAACLDAAEDRLSNRRLDDDRRVELRTRQEGEVPFGSEMFDLRRWLRGAATSVGDVTPAPIRRPRGCSRPGRPKDYGYGGEKGIRTLDTLSRIHTFQACAFNHSATSPTLRRERALHMRWRAGLQARRSSRGAIARCALDRPRWGEAPILLLLRVSPAGRKGAAGRGAGSRDRPGRAAGVTRR